MEQQQHYKQIKRNDTGPPIRAQIISDTDSNAVDLSGASVSFHMYQVNDDGTQTELVNAAAVIETPATDGYVRYDWSSGDTETLGTHLAEFEVTYSGGSKETYPRSGYINIRIEADLDNA